jgi:hypothetical protein
MPEDLFMARLFWSVGGTLAALGALFWFTLPIRPMFPPYLGTALFSLGYGTWCWYAARRPGGPPKS